MTAAMQAARWKRVHGLQWSRLVCFTLVLWTRRMEGLADFSNYLSRILTSQHALAWDGQPLRLHCPRHSTVSVLSAFYGSGGGGDDARPCGGGGAGAPVRAENSSCSAFTALPKMMSVCQSQRQCSLAVSPLLFGRDPCPGTRKYLTVVYKCKPTEHKRLAVCEGGRLMLRCKPPRVLNIYAAVYGRDPDQTPDTCPPPQLTATRTGPPPFECLNHEAVHTVSQSCYSKQRCAIAVNNRTFRDPCIPGTRKHLTVLYACVPETLLRAADPELQTPASPTPDLENGPPVDMVATFPKGPHLPTYPGAMMSDSLMTYGYIKEHPETAALLFTCSVCVGLLLTLLAVSVRVTCRPGPLRCHAGARRRRRRRAEEEADGDDDDDDKEEEGTGSSLISTKDRKSIKDWEEVTYVSEAAERAERMERREMVMQEIWMNAYMNGAPEELTCSDI